MDAEILERVRSSLVRELRLEPGDREGSARQHKGLALCNVNQRIKMFFGPEYGLYVTSTPMVGTNVEVVIPAATEPPELEKKLFFETEAAV